MPTQTRYHPLLRTRRQAAYGWETGGFLVAIDLSNEIKRPVTALLAVVGVIGWIVAVYSVSSARTERGAASVRIQELERLHGAATGELDKQRQAATTLADLQKRAAETQAAAAKAAAERDATNGSLIVLRASMEAIQREILQARADAEAKTKQVAEIHAQMNDASQGLAQTQRQLQEADIVLGTRMQSLADATGRLGAAVAQEVEVRQAIIAGFAEIARLETGVQGARQAEAEAQKQLAETRGQLLQAIEEASKVAKP
jgi:chromosome segregation ATPase